MSFQASTDQRASPELSVPADVHWDMLDKSKFFVLGAALFSGVSATLYPVTVLKTRQQVSSLPSSSSFKLLGRILQHEGLQGLYRGFPTSLLGTIPARGLYVSTLECTKSIAGDAAVTLGFSASAAAASANAVGGLAASVAAQLVWTPVDVISQRLMVQSNNVMDYSQKPESQRTGSGRWTELRKTHVSEDRICGLKSSRYRGGFDAFKCIIRTDGLRGLYRGFGMSIITYAPSNALWWASYCLTQRTIWGSLGYQRDSTGGCPPSPSHGMVMGVQGASAACAGGVTALLTTPLDTIKTRLQVEDRRFTARETILSLMEEGGWRACFRGLGPRWAMMAMSAVTMITTYEFLKRSSKKQDIKGDM